MGKNDINSNLAPSANTRSSSRSPTGSKSSDVCSLDDLWLRISARFDEIDVRLSARMDGLETRLNNEECRIELIEKNINSLQIQAKESTQRTFNINDVIEEVNDQSSRVNNLLFFNIDESDLEGDKEKVSSFFSSASFKVVINKIFRMGAVREGSIRPVKVIFGSSCCVKWMLVTFKGVLPPTVKFSTDRTALQRSHLKNLKDEIDQRKAKGELDLHIKYFNGVPKIKKIKNSHIHSALNNLDPPKN